MNSEVVEMCGDIAVENLPTGERIQNCVWNMRSRRHPLGRAFTNGRVERSQTSRLKFRAELIPEEL